MLWMPTSNVTRVRSEGFSKMSAMCLPRSTEAKRDGTRLDLRGALQQVARVRGRPFGAGEEILGDAKRES